MSEAVMDALAGAVGVRMMSYASSVGHLTNSLSFLEHSSGSDNISLDHCEHMASFRSRKCGQWEGCLCHAPRFLSP